MIFFPKNGARKTRHLRERGGSLLCAQVARLWAPILKKKIKILNGLVPLVTFALFCTLLHAFFKFPGHTFCGDMQSYWLEKLGRKVGISFLVSWLRLWRSFFLFLVFGALPAGGREGWPPSLPSRPPLPAAQAPKSPKMIFIFSRRTNAA